MENYLFHYFSVTPFCNLNPHGIRGLQTVSVGRLLKLLFLKLPPSPSTAEPPEAFNEIPPRCRVPQAFDHPTTLSSPPAGAVLSGPQGRRKNDPFSPQARWGDDGARRVVKHVTALCSTSHPHFYPPHPSRRLRARVLPRARLRSSRKPRVYWVLQPLKLAVTPGISYVELGFLILLKGKLSSIRMDIIRCSTWC